MGHIFYNLRQYTCALGEGRVLQRIEEKNSFKLHLKILVNFLFLAGTVGKGNCDQPRGKDIPEYDDIWYSKSKM